MATSPSLQAPPHLPATPSSDTSAPARPPPTTGQTSNELIARVGEWKRQIGRQIATKRFPGTNSAVQQPEEQQSQLPPRIDIPDTTPPDAPSSIPHPKSTTQAMSSTTTLTNTVSPPPATPHTNVELPSTGIRIQTTLAALSSGFPYTDALFSLSISPATWSTFTAEVVSAARISIAQRGLVVGTALGVGIAGMTTPLGILSVGPAIVAGKVMYDRQVVRKVKDGSDGEGKLGEVIRKWNEDVFGAKGVVVSLEIPAEAVEREKAEKVEKKREKKVKKQVEKDEKRAEKEEKKKRKKEKKEKEKNGAGEEGEGNDALEKTTSTLPEEEGNSQPVKLENEGKFKKRFQLVILPLPVASEGEQNGSTAAGKPLASPLQHHDSFGSATTVSPSVASELDGSPIWERQADGGESQVYGHGMGVGEGENGNLLQIPESTGREVRMSTLSLVSEIEGSPVISS